MLAALKPTNPNQAFIDGTWYEFQYRTLGTTYNSFISSPLPEWARDMNQYAVDMVVACLGLPSEAKVLDLGSGVGNFVRAFKNRGFDAWGIDISPTAVQDSFMDTMVVGTVAELPFKDKEFDLVFSAAFFEHVDESILSQTIKESYRVGKRQAHFIGLEKGCDPSHINIKSVDEWAKVFVAHRNERDSVFVVDNTLDREAPFFLAVPRELLPYQMARIKRTD